MTPERMAHETDSAVEQLLLKSNGRKKTVQDVFEVVVAMHHDRTHDTMLLLNEIKGNREMVEKHLSEDVRMTNAEFNAMMADITKRRDAEVERLEADIDAIKGNCEKLHVRAERRRGDPAGQDWRSTTEQGDEELADMRRFWRVTRWGLAIAATPFLFAIGSHLADLIWN